MNPPLADATDLTCAIVSAAKPGDWPHFGRLHERRAQLLKSGLYGHSRASRLLPQLDAAQRQLATMPSDATVLEKVSEPLRPISDDGTHAAGARRARGNVP